MSFLLSAAVVFLIFLALTLLFLRPPVYFKSLSGKHVVITGASSGIGFALVKKCVSEGAFVTLMARSEKSLFAALETLTKTSGCQPDRILLKAVDVSDADAVSLAIAESFRWRPIDILICNAGQWRPGLLDAVNVKDLDLVIKTNFLGCVYTIHAALPLMKSRSMENPSSIVIMCSLSGLFLTPGMNVYTPTKYALKELAELLRLELMPYKIRVNLVCPGFTRTPMLDEADKDATTSELLQKLCFYDRTHAESPDEVATKTMEGVKMGDFLITTIWGGFIIRVLARGLIPAESIATVLIEFILLVPVRIMSLAWFVYVHRVSRRQLEENLQKHKHRKEEKQRKEEVYIHSIDDSAADDDNNLYLWTR